MNLKYKLTLAVYREISDPDGLHFSDPDDDAYYGSNIDTLFKSMWRNTSPTGGLALTTTGLTHLSSILKLKKWELDVDASAITSADILMLERYMTTPFFLIYPYSKKHNFIVFDESLVAQLMLYGNDLKLFLQAHDSASNRPVKRT